MKRLLFLLFLLILVIGAFLFFRSNRPGGSPATIWEQPAEISMEAAQLFNDFVQDEQGANEKYLNKITEVTGEVSSINTSHGHTSVLLKTNDQAHGVRCRLDLKPGTSAKNYEIGQNVRFKCVCSGFVEDVEMVQCVER